ncbi:hypothetical protein UG53_24365 [Vibrio sp. S512-13]|nr:hypothetical protein UG53_24365 [Vibrio sp. S512-13]
MLLKRPMVVGYRVNTFTAFLSKRLLKTKYVSLLTILADDAVEKEYLQDDCTPDNLFNEVSRLLERDNKPMLDKFTEMHHWIRKDADLQAANAVLKLIET